MESLDEEPAYASRARHSGHYYHGVYVSESARAQLGDTFISAPQNLENELHQLPYAAEASFNSYIKQHEPLCLPNTRIDVLRRIRAWAGGQDERCIFWLNGMAGTGKSTIARTIAREYYKHNLLGASFFFSRGDGDASHAGKFFTSIAVQLANQSSSLRRYICDAITKQRDIACRSLRDQWASLIYLPLSNLHDNSLASPLVLVIDALDECEGENNIRVILQLLAEVKNLQTAQLRIFITSRPETPIRLGFRAMPSILHHDLVLHEVSQAIVNNDILLFLRDRFKEITDASEDLLPPSWPGEQAIQHVLQMSGGLFIWAAIACRFIQEGRQFAEDRLSTLLQSGSTSVTKPEENLNAIYIAVLRNSISHGYEDQEKDNMCQMLRNILGSVAILFSPLPIFSLARILHTSEQNVNQTLVDLHSILSIPKHLNLPIRLHHPSFRDFLLEKDRCCDPHFWVDKKQAHRTVADNCLKLMSDVLKHDICGLHAPGALVSDLESSHIEQCLSSDVQYACIYWVQHLQRSGAQLYDNDHVHQFLLKYFLHWLEALSLMQKTSEGLLAVILLESIVSSNICPLLHTFLHDAKRFCLYNRSAVEVAPLQTYCSSLVFAPETSIIKRQFKNEMPHWISRLSNVPQNWSSLLQTLEHKRSVDAVAFSRDSKLVASGSEDCTIRLWNSSTGVLQQRLEGHRGPVKAIAFSPDSKLIASGSYDCTVRLWDADTGVLQQQLESYAKACNATVSFLNVPGGWVHAVAFSQDSKLVASGSTDGTVKLWDIATGALQQTLKGHTDLVDAVVFSQDSMLVASGSCDHTVRLWNTATGVLQHRLEHKRSVYTVAFSQDGKLVASGSGDCIIRLWNPATGVLQQILKSHRGPVNAVAFSQDSKLVVSGSNDHTVRLWNAATGVLQQTLESHTGSVKAVAFSEDSKLVASGSDDCTLRLWDVTTEILHQTPQGHTSWIRAVAFSQDGRLIASSSSDGTIRLWNAATGALQQILIGHTDWVNAVAFSQDSKLASGSSDRTVRLWDTATGVLQQTLKGHTDWINAVAFSQDSKLMISGSNDRTVRLWNAVTGLLQQTLNGHTNTVNAVAFSEDSKLVVSGSGDHTVRIWNTGTGVLQQTLKGHENWVMAVAFSQDRKLVASSSYDRTVRLWDTATGALQQVLNIDTFYDKPYISFHLHSPPYLHHLSFSEDGQYLETNRGPLSIQTSDFGHSLQPPSGIFLKDQWVTLNSKNLLWLPYDYYPVRSAVRGNILVIGCVSGRVAMIKFNLL